jgi:asparagine synthase (glutamine-hydrolysing)
VTDEQLQGNLFPLQTPHSKEEYYYRAIFMNIQVTLQKLYVRPQEGVACSTKIALEWDEAFKNK